MLGGNVAGEDRLAPEFGALRWISPGISFQGRMCSFESDFFACCRRRFLHCFGNLFNWDCGPGAGNFPWLERFKEADLKLGSPAANEERVVFMGDSITEAWHFDALGGVFAAKPYINRGISGQTTPQMVLRFHQDVIALQPKAVVILAGTNDIAGNTGPMTLEETEANIAAMAEMADTNHIRVVLCSILPAYDYPWQPGLTPAPKIDLINAWMRGYAAAKGYVYVDYHSAMKDSRDGLPANLSHDGVHPTQAGYDVMAPLVEAGIGKALKGMEK